MEQEPQSRPQAESLALQVQELRRRVEDLEQKMAESHAPEVFNDRPPTSRLAEAPFYPAGSATKVSPDKVSSLESQIGAHWFNRIGVFAVLAGAAWSLKLAIDREWIGPNVRVIIGLIVAAVLITWSERFRRSESLSFSYSLKALGAAIAYLSLWAASNLYHVWPAPLAFGGMVAVTIIQAYTAWRQDSELLAALALALGMATPGLLAIGGEQELFLLLYLLLLDVGTLALSTLRPWQRLILGAFLGTTSYLVSLLFAHLHRADHVTESIFLALFFVCFNASPLFGKNLPPRHQQLSWSFWLPVAVAIATFTEALYLRSPPLDSLESAWAATTLAIVSLVFVFVSRRVERHVDGRQHPGIGVTLANVHLCVAAVFFAIAGLLAFHGYGITLCWLAEMLVLTAASVRFRNDSSGRTLLFCATGMLLVAFAGSFLLEGYDPRADTGKAFFNAHFMTYLLGLACFGATVALTGGKRLTDPEQSSATRHHELRRLAALATIAFNIIALLSVSIQIKLYWWQQEIRSPGETLHRPVIVDFSYSAWFTMYGGILMAVGVFRRSAFLRWQALTLLSLSVAKAILYDTNHLNEGYRIVSFLGLGVLLLAVSLVYQRGWMATRSAERTDK